jgi:outer membrane lipoprotein-sorting protein
VLVVALAAVFAWRDRSGPPPVDQILASARMAADSPAPAGFRNFVVKETSEVRPLDASGAEQVKAEISRWYEAPGRWRREVASTVIGPDGRPVSRNGLTTVSDGSAVWLYRARDNSVMVQPYGHAAGSDELGPFPEVTGGLSDLLARATACYAPHLTGSARVAGRAAYVIDLGSSRCGDATTAGDPPVEWTIWVDKHTFLILKSEQDVGGRVLATTAVTSVQYDVPIEPARFVFATPPGAKLRDNRVPTATP